MEMPLKTGAEGVVIDTFRQSDVDVLVDHLNDPVVYANTLSIPSPYHPEDAIKFYNGVQVFKKQSGDYKDFVIRKDGMLIGGIGLLYNHGLQSHKSEFGYWLTKSMRGKGIMTAVVDAFVEYVFATRTISRVEAHVFQHNPASARVLEKCGFEREGLIKNAFLKDEKLISAFLYARCK